MKASLKPSNDKQADKKTGLRPNEGVVESARPVSGSVALQNPGSLTLPAGRGTRVLRQAAILQMQSRHGNGYVQRMIADYRNGKPPSSATTIRAAPAAAVQRACQCGGACGCSEKEEEAQRTPLEGQRVQRQADGASQPGALIVEDEAPTLQAGQMRKSDFLNQLREATCEAADESLAGTMYSVAGCPYIRRVFARLPGRSAAYIDRGIRRFAPEAAAATAASEYIPHITRRVQTGIANWLETGQVTGIPEGLAGFASGSAAGETPTAAAAAGTVERQVDESLQRLPEPLRIQRQLGHGRRLDSAIQGRMEKGLGRPLGDVVIHTGARAAQLAREQNARAFAVGKNVVFGQGQYQPGTLIGDAILAHELAHVVQQRGADPSSASESVQRSRDNTGSLEQDADQSAIGAVIALYGGASEALKTAGPMLKSGLALRRCDWFSGPTPAPTPSPPTPGPTDFLIRGRNVAPGDTDNIYFDRNSTTIDPGELAKIPAIISDYGAARNLTLNGFRSEDEPASHASDRVNAVDSELGTARTGGPTAHPAHTGTRAKVPMPAAGVGEIMYREVRKVEVLPTPSGHLAAPSRRPAACGTATVSCPPAPNHFTRAQTLAKDWLDKAITELGKATLDPAVQTDLDTLFGGGGTAPAGTAAFIVGKLTNLKAHVNAMTTQHQCHNLCDGRCNSSPAYNVGTGIGAPGTGAMMTLCPSFFTSSDPDNADTLIHEGAHGTTGLETKDHAYGHERGITILSTALAKKNSDSYALLVRRINAPGSATIGFAGDTRPGITAGSTEDRQAQVALAHLEKWLVYAYQSTQSAYETVKEAVATGAWPTAAPGPWGRGLVRDLVPLFGLTDPGTTAPFTLPVDDDKFKLAAIRERFHRMRSTMWGKAIKMQKVSSGSDSWAAGPGPDVRLTSAFFSLPSDLARVRRLCELIVAATPDISPALEPSYVDAADKIRSKRGAGP